MFHAWDFERRILTSRISAFGGNKDAFDKNALIRGAVKCRRYPKHSGQNQIALHCARRENGRFVHDYSQSDHTREWDPESQCAITWRCVVITDYMEAIH